MDIESPTAVAIPNQSPTARVARSLREWIREGQWAAGERLPAEMDLVQRLHVSRGTVRSALRLLKAEGLVQELPGRGRKLRSRIVAPTPGSLPSGLMARTAVLITHGQGAVSDNPNVYAAGRAELAVDAGVMDAIHAHGLHVLCINSASFEESEANQLIAGRPCGVIAGRPASQFPHVPQLLKNLKDSGIHLVTTGHDPDALGTDRVISDHEAGAYMLTRWLIDRGCRRIVEMGTGDLPPGIGWIASRTIGYRRAMREAGLEALPRVHATNVEPAHSPVIAPALQRQKGSVDARDVFERRIRQLAGFVAGVVAGVVLGSNPADAIMASNDWDASIILGACRLLGLEPNKQVAVVGYDDWYDTEERDWEPATPLATMDKLNADIGRQAVQMLMDRIEGKLPPEPQIWRVEPRLVEVVPAEVA